MHLAESIQLVRIGHITSSLKYSEIIFQSSRVEKPKYINFVIMCMLNIHNYSTLIWIEMNLSIVIWHLLFRNCFPRPCSGKAVLTLFHFCCFVVSLLCFGFVEAIYFVIVMPKTFICANILFLFWCYCSLMQFLSSFLLWYELSDASVIFML